MRSGVVADDRAPLAGNSLGGDAQDQCGPLSTAAA